MRIRLVALIATGVLAEITTAHAENRIALVIGNSDYSVASLKLANPTNDAVTMQHSLEAAGFKVTAKLNAKRIDFYHLVQQFSDQVARDPHAVGLFYYAGHGVQSNGENYLIPVDADIRSDAELEASAYAAGRVLRALKDAHNEMNIVILDACRDNPLPKTTRGVERGLARMDAPSGTFIAYAAGPGQSAHDGASGTNGVFTGELAKAMAKPGVPLEQMFKKVIAGVKADTHGEQQPWSEASIQGDIYFHTGPAEAYSAALITTPDPSPVIRTAAVSTPEPAAAQPSTGAGTPIPEAPTPHYGFATFQKVQTIVTRVSSEQYSALPGNAVVAVYKSPAEVRAQFEVLAVVGHADPCAFRTCTLDDAIATLSTKAREIGANAIIIDNSHTVQTSRVSTGISVSARAVRMQ